MGQQYLRKWSLTVSSNTETINFEDLRFKFKTEQSDIETPNNLRVRVYNLSTTTANTIKLPEFNQVSLSAGYQDGPFGVIFNGEVIQYRKGRESQTDKYFDIIARDTDDWSNFAMINKTLAAGATPDDQVNAVLQASNGQLAKGSLPPFTGYALPRGKVLYGLARETMRDLANSQQARFSTRNGKLNVIPLTSYIESQAIVLNSMTGLISIPEQSIDGIKARALINPNLIIGQPVKINNADIQDAEFDVAYAAINKFPDVSTDGLYRILVAEFTGDTRGNDWYVDLTCLSIDPSSSPSASVKSYPTGN